MNTETITFKGQTIVVTRTEVSPTRVNVRAHFADGRAVRSYDAPSEVFDLEADTDCPTDYLLDHWALIF